MLVRCNNVLREYAHGVLREMKVARGLLKALWVATVINVGGRRAGGLVLVACCVAFRVKAYEAMRSATYVLAGGTRRMQEIGGGGPLWQCMFSLFSMQDSSALLFTFP